MRTPICYNLMRMQQISCQGLYWGEGAKRVQLANAHHGDNTSKGLNSIGNHAKHIAALEKATVGQPYAPDRFAPRQLPSAISHQPWCSLIRFSFLTGLLAITTMLLLLTAQGFSRDDGMTGQALIHFLIQASAPMQDCPGNSPTDKIWRRELY